MAGAFSSLFVAIETDGFQLCKAGVVGDVPLLGPRFWGRFKTCDEEEADGIFSWWLLFGGAGCRGRSDDVVEWNGAVLTIFRPWLLEVASTGGVYGDVY